MKKLLLSFLLSATAYVCAAQTVPYLNTKWTVSNIDTIKKQINRAVGDQYKFTDKKIIENIAYLNYSNPNNARTLSVSLLKGLSGGNPDMGMPRTEIVRQVSIAGVFADVYPAYQKLFNTATEMEQIKQKGYAKALTIQDGDKTYIVSLARGNQNAPGYWNLDIKIN